MDLALEGAERVGDLGLSRVVAAKLFELSGGGRSSGDGEIREHAFERVADDRQFFEIARGDDGGEFANVAWKIFFENRHEIEEEFAIVVDSREQFGEIDRRFIRRTGLIPSFSLSFHFVSGAANSLPIRLVRRRDGRGQAVSSSRENALLGRSEIHFELDDFIFECDGEHSAGGRQFRRFADGESAGALHDGDDLRIVREFGTADEENVTTANLLVVANPSDGNATTVRRRVARDFGESRTETKISEHANVDRRILEKEKAPVGPIDETWKCSEESRLAAAFARDVFLAPWRMAKPKQSQPRGSTATDLSAQLPRSRRGDNLARSGDALALCWAKETQRLRGVWGK